MAVVAARTRRTVPAPAARRRRRDPVRHLVLAGLLVLVLLMVAPLLVVALNAVKSPAEYAANGPLALPRHLYLSGIVDFWNRVKFGRVLLNSLVISGAVALLGVLVAVLNAYALGIGKVPGRILFLIFFLLANLLPQEKLVHLYNTQLAVIIIFTVIQGAFGTYLLASVFDGFPQALLDAAAVDGAGRWRTLWRVVVPVSRPSLAVLLTFFFIWTWNEFFLPLIFLI